MIVFLVLRRKVACRSQSMLGVASVRPWLTIDG